ncbi:hypothetical protein C8J57DRAFT_1673263 [Mycena rebaudengoi]|nr:hypothetical protein C8J57DRAFT_1673263 [Mycena rebaudengoi]
MADTNINIDADDSNNAAAPVRYTLSGAPAEPLPRVGRGWKQWRKWRAALRDIAGLHGGQGHGHGNGHAEAGSEEDDSGSEDDEDVPLEERERCFAGGERIGISVENPNGGRRMPGGDLSGGLRDHNLSCSRRRARAVVLVEGTKDVALKKYLKPNVAKKLLYYIVGYIRNVDLGDNRIADQVKAAVEAVFTHVGELSAYGVRLLRAQSFYAKTANGTRNKRQSFHLRPVKGVLDMDSWKRARAMATVKDAGAGFKNTVFISINLAGPNLVFRGSDISAEYPTRISAQTRTVPLTLRATRLTRYLRKSSDPAKETEPTRTGEHNDSTPHAGETKTVNSAQTSISEEKNPNPPEKPRVHRLLTVTKWFDIDDLYSDDENLSGQESGQHRPDPADEKDFLHLLKNMSKPENAKDKRWWRGTPLEHFRDFNVIMPLLADIIDSAESSSRYLTPPSTSDDATHELETQQKFDNTFAPGPGGINILLPVFAFLFPGLEHVLHKGYTLNTYFWTTLLSLNNVSEVLLSCLQHLRTNYPRHLWDPKHGFRELGTILCAYDEKLPVGKRTNSMYLNIDAVELFLGNSR